MGAEVASWAQTHTSPVPSPKVVVRKVAHSSARAQKACHGQWPPRELAFPPKGLISSAWSLLNPRSPSALPLLPTHTIHFPGQNANSELGHHPLFSGQKMDSRLSSEYRTALLLIVHYVPVPSALTFPARRVTRRGIVMFTLQTRKSSPETPRDWLRDLPVLGLRSCHPAAFFCFLTFPILCTHLSEWDEFL